MFSFILHKLLKSGMIYIGGVESAKYWGSVMNDLKSREVQDVLIFYTDNLTGISEAIKACYPQSDHQKCIVHQIRNSVKHVGYKDLKEVCTDLKKSTQLQMQKPDSKI